MLLTKCGAEGYGILDLLFEEILGQAFYLKVDKIKKDTENEELLLLAKAFSTSYQKISEVVDLAVAKDIFDKSKLNDHGVLTSREIQQEYFEVTHLRNFELSEFEQKILLVNPNNYRREVKDKPLLINETVAKKLATASTPKKPKKEAKAPLKPPTADVESPNAEVLGYNWLKEC